MRWIAWIGFAAVLATLSVTVAQGPIPAYERSRLAIETQSATHDFDVELALTPEQQQQGLMFRQQLPPDHGMLFVQARERAASMWMKNTFLPLDMLFIDAAGRISHIAERTVPQSLQTISWPEPVLAVLELNGGTAARLGIAVGDRVVHPVFGTGP